jgi:hypothetical protein
MSPSRSAMGLVGCFLGVCWVVCMVFSLGCFLVLDVAFVFLVGAGWVAVCFWGGCVLIY